jgi:hypothetical protein
MSYLGGYTGQIIIPSGDGGGGGGEVVPYTSSLQKSTFDRRSGNLTIPAGALFVEVVNLDPMNSITVNGRTVLGGERWHSEKITNEVDRTEEYVEEVSILSSSVEYLFRVSYPASSPVNPNTI